LFQPLDDLRLEAIQFGQVQVNVLAVQLPQSSDHLAQLLLVEILLLENTLQLDRLLDALAGFASELPDISRGEAPARVCAAEVSKASLILADLPIRSALTPLLALLAALALLPLLALLALTLLILALLALLAPLTEPA